jgi:hypothetical protein
MKNIIMFDIAQLLLVLGILEVCPIWRTGKDEVYRVVSNLNHALRITDI